MPGQVRYHNVLMYVKYCFQFICVRHDDEVANKHVLWQPRDWHANRGRQKITYVDNLLQDTGLENTNELQTVMVDRGCWKGCVFNAGRLERRPR